MDWWNRFDILLEQKNIVYRLLVILDRRFSRNDNELANSATYSKTLIFAH